MDRPFILKKSAQSNEKQVRYDKKRKKIKKTPKTS
jgi:hypothetical protein